MTRVLFSFLLKLDSHHPNTFTSPLQQTLSQIHRASHNCNCTLLLLETEWSEVILIWLFVSIKFTRSFLKLSFLISLFKRFPLQFAYTNITFFLRFFQSEWRHLVFSFAHFLNKIVKPKRETSFSKLLKGYICYEFPK